MTHLTYIIPAYAIFVLLAVGFAANAWQRMASAKRRLAAIDPRGMR